MGYYIETPEAKEKADFLIENEGAVERPHPPSELIDPKLGVSICVVDNGLFEAAAIIVDNGDLSAFSDPSDGRPKRWLSMDRSDVVRMNPRVATKI